METTDLTSIHEAVLSQELLLKKIVGYALNFSSTNRLVNKQWLLATTRQCRKSGTPLFTISAKFDVLNCIATLKKMKSSLSSSLDDNQLPPIKLKIYDTVLLLEYQQDISTMFLECASSLTEIELYLACPEKQLVSSLPSTIKFSALRFASIYFFQRFGPSSSKADLQNFLNNLFRVSPTLKKVTSIGDMPGNLTFPASVTSLELNHSLTNVEVNHFLQSSLPNLQHLHLDLQHSENFKKVLAKFSSTLRSFTILEKGFPDWNCGVELQLPLMEHLNTLEIRSALIVLPDASIVKKMLPSLEVLGLPGHAIDKLTKEVKQPNMASFEKIKDLTLLRRSGEAFGFFNPTLLHSQIIRGVSLMFPNLIKLTMELSFNEVPGLYAVFRDLFQLKSLHIIVEDYSDTFMDSSVIDSVLTGCASSELHLYSLPILKKREQQNRYGIKQMTELEELGLRTAGFTIFTQYTSNANMPVFSDLSFHLAFFELPKLRKLCFGGRFKVTGEMHQQWEALGRSITQN